MIPVIKPIFNAEMEEAAIFALRNEKFVMGESVHKFEEEFAAYCGTKYAVSTSSGTNALQYALAASGVAAGKEVLTTPASFVATSNAALQNGATPVFSDADYVSNNLDAEKIGPAITHRTAALLPVHLYGLMADMKRICEAGEERGIPVIEDACQAHGAVLGGKKAGSLGSCGCFSFYSTKNLTVCGDGGMVTTNDGKIADAVAKMRDCGRTSQYEHDVLGYTSRLNTVNAAIGRVQLRMLDGWNEKRGAAARKYCDLLKGIEGLALPPVPGGNEHVFHLFACKTPRRDALREHLRADGILTLNNYPIPIHLQPLYRRMFGYKGGEFPVAERICNEVVCLPMFPEISDDEIKSVVESIRRFFV